MKQNFTSIIVIIDRSSSMHSTANATISGFNEFLETQKKEAGEAILTLATFSDVYELVHDGINIHDVPALTTETYRPSGMTALLDAVGRTINVHGAKLASMKEEDRPSKVLVMIMTDGEENSSREFQRHQVLDLVTHQKNKYNWEFVFIGANIDAVQVGTSLGVAAATSYNYTSDVRGTQRLYANVTKGVTNLRRAVGSAGAAPAAASFSMDEPDADQDADPNVKDALEQLKTMARSAKTISRKS